MFFEPIVLALQKFSGYLVRRNYVITCTWENGLILDTKECLKFLSAEERTAETSTYLQLSVNSKRFWCI